MRILVGSVAHESNTFTPLPTTWRDFRTTRGQEILDRPRPGSLAGIVATLRERGVELVPTIATHALPGGVVQRDGFEEMRRSLLAGADGADAACIFLHGAMRAEGEDYADTVLVSALRQAMGPDAPIVVALDLHGNITQGMVDAATALVTYRTAPHIDTFETGQRAARLLLRVLDEGARPVSGYMKLPILLPGEFAQTAEEPMASMVRLLEATDAKPGVLSSSFAKVHCWADIPDQGVAALVVADGDRALAEREVRALANAFWGRRAEFRSTVETYDVDRAIAVGLAAPEATVFLSDSGDNPGAGGTTDVPLVVERLLAAGAASAAVATIWDAEALARCAEAGVGQEVSLVLGGKIDTRHGRPLAVTGRVKALSDGRYYREGIRQPERLVEMGRLGVLAIGGVEVMLSEERVSIHDPEQMRAIGMEPLSYKLVSLKRGYLEPLFQAISPRSILMLSPGATNCDLTKLEYRRVRRPIYPLDPEMSWASESR